MNVKQKIGALSALSVPALPVMAAVPEGAEAIFTTAATDFATVLGYGFVAAAAIVGGFITFQLVLKVAKRSTKG